LKVTVPVGVPVPDGPLTVAVNVTLWLRFDGLDEELAAVVVVAWPIMNPCGTSVAALKLVSPACFAVTVHDPAAVICTVFVLIVQLPLAVKLTVRLDDDAALTVKSASPKVLFAKDPNVIVWLALAIVNDCGAFAAAL
jgi:hypothetical protein